MKRARTKSNQLVGDKRSEDELPDLQGVSFLELKQPVAMCIIRFNETMSNSGRINKHMTISFLDRRWPTNSHVLRRSLCVFLLRDSGVYVHESCCPGNQRHLPTYSPLSLRS